MIHFENIAKLTLAISSIACLLIAAGAFGGAL